MNDMSASPRYRRAVTSDRVKQDAPAWRIVDRFGGLANFCEATGFSMSAVHRWTIGGLVPAKWRWDEGLGIHESYPRYIMRRAHALGVELRAQDFIEQLDFDEAPGG